MGVSGDLLILLQCLPVLNTSIEFHCARLLVLVSLPIKLSTATVYRILSSFFQDE